MEELNCGEKKRGKKKVEKYACAQLCQGTWNDVGQTLLLKPFPSHIFLKS